MIHVISPEMKIHHTPQENLIYDGRDLHVESDDVNEQRVKMKFSPCQAFRVTTIDCFDVQSLFADGKFQRAFLEMSNSPWADSLREELWQRDQDATFMNMAPHFILPFQENIVEVLAWEVVRIGT